MTFKSFKQESNRIANLRNDELFLIERSFFLARKVFRLLEAFVH